MQSKINFLNMLATFLCGCVCVVQDELLQAQKIRTRIRARLRKACSAQTHTQACTYAAEFQTRPEDNTYSTRTIHTENIHESTPTHQSSPQITHLLHRRSPEIVQEDVLQRRMRP